MIRNPPRAVQWLVVITLVAGGCGIAEPSFESTAGSSAATSTTVDTDPPIDEAFLAQQLELVDIPDSGGSAMVVVMTAGGDVVFAARGADPGGTQPTPDDTFRIGSISKVFASAVTLTLVDDGLVGLDTPVSTYVTRVPVPESITVRDLLQHTSGLPNYSEELGLMLLRSADPGRVWTPEELLESFPLTPLLFPSGTSWHYSNTNYIVLGVLIEEVTGRSFAEVLRTRIIIPLGLDSTYVSGFENGPAPFSAHVSSAPSGAGLAVPLEFELTAISTMDWASGAVVSSAGDLHRLFDAVFGRQMFSSVALEEMVGSPWQAYVTELSNADYGLGVELWNVLDGRSVKGLVGHGGHVEGHQTLVLHAPESGMTAFWVATSDHIDLWPAFGAVAERLAHTQ